LRIRKFGFLNVAVILLAMNGPRAFAHAHLHKAVPAKNEVVHQAPQRVSLSFSEALEPAMCKVEVKDLGTGEVISDGKLKAVEATTLEVALKPLKASKGVYEVSWKVVSKDTHKMSGLYKFTVDPTAK
jgi:methionine-rich copper-binding protein CopC